MVAVSEYGEVLWSPPSPRDEATQVARYLRWLEQHRGLRFDDYAGLHSWSVNDLEGFWSALWDFFEIGARGTPYERVLASREMPGAQWFTGARLNFARVRAGRDEDCATVAVIAHSQTRGPIDVTFGGPARAGRRRAHRPAALGVGPGDRVVGYLPNIPETLVAFLAIVSLGATGRPARPSSARAA